MSEQILIYAILENGKVINFRHKDIVDAATGCYDRIKAIAESKGYTIQETDFDNPLVSEYCEAELQKELLKTHALFMINKVDEKERQILELRCCENKLLTGEWENDYSLLEKYEYLGTLTEANTAVMELEDNSYDISDEVSLIKFAKDVLKFKIPDHYHLICLA